MMDTNMNVQESLDTLLVQQQRLIDGKRMVQMFPTGTKELSLPVGMRRTQNRRGVFHFNPKGITEKEIFSLSAHGRENEFLELGPFNKTDVCNRLIVGELLEIITEYTPMGVEVRSAAGTNKTLPIQKAYFERTKEANNKIVCGPLPRRVRDRLKEMNYGSN